MDRLVILLEGESCRNLLLALAHTLWQGALAAGVLFFYLRRTPAAAANQRYVAGVAALGAIVVGALLTWSILSYQPAEATRDSGPVMISGARDTANHPATSASTAPYDNGLASPAREPARAAGSRQVWIMEAWLAGVALMLLRLAALMRGGSRLRRRCRLIEDVQTLALVEQLRARMGIDRRIRVLVGDPISTPGVVGCFWPTLLLPASMVSGIPAEDLQAILTHELAHIRRYDYLVNFFQMVVEALLFFNPAVWWISRQIRIEREACCDAAGVLWTGQRHKYAEVLVAWAQRLGASRGGTPAPAVGFGQEADGGSILDRVRRILVAGHQPRPHVPWHIATAMLVLSLACLVVLQQATGLAVNLAGRILTPQERIDKIAGISREYGYENREYGPEDKIEVSGVVRTWDAKPLPRHTNALVQHAGRQSGSVFLPVSNDFHLVSQEGEFDTSINPGRFYVTVFAEGYAPAFSGPLEARRGTRLERIELVLGDGFPGRIQTADESGQPIPEAKLSGGYTTPEDASYIDTLKLTTDANGIATLDHAAAQTMTLQIEADGFEAERVQGLVLRPDQATVLTLKRSQPATGTVLSEATGQPVAGAQVHILMSVRGPQSWGNGSITRAADAVTDADGRFQLTRLRRDRHYLLFVRASGYGYRYVPEVEPGRHVQVLLGEKKIIRGAIVGNLSLLTTDAEWGTPIIRVTNSYRYPESNGYSDASGKSRVTLRDGLGFFEIDDFWGQTVRLWAGSESVLLYPQEDRLDNIVIDLRASAHRQVVLRFATPAGGPPIEGGVRIDYITDRARRQKQGMTAMRLDIRDGQASCEIPVPAQFKYTIDFHQGKRPVGYWFNQIQPIVVAPGDDPFVIDVPVYPAGAIYGRIFRPDGSPAEQARAALITAKKPDIENGQSISLLSLFEALSNGLDRGTFNATPLPLGGQYAIVAYEDYAFAMSDTFALDEKNPIVNVDLRLPQGVDVEGRLLDVNGTPARNEVSLDVSLKRGEQSWGTSSAPIRPDETGRFVFRNVNPGPQGTCLIEGSGGPGYRPIKHRIPDITSPVIIRLEKGVRVSGTVIDDATGWPVPGAEVYASPVIMSDDQLQHHWEMLNAENRTDAQGRFVFTNMARRPYQLGVRGANPAGAGQSPRVTGGQNEPVVLRIRIPEGSNLKPIEP